MTNHSRRRQAVVGALIAALLSGGVAATTAMAAGDWKPLGNATARGAGKGGSLGILGMVAKDPRALRFEFTSGPDGSVSREVFSAVEIECWNIGERRRSRTLSRTYFSTTPFVRKPELPMNSPDRCSVFVTTIGGAGFTNTVAEMQ